MFPLIRGGEMEKLKAGKHEEEEEIVWCKPGSSDGSRQLSDCLDMWLE